MSLLASGWSRVYAAWIRGGTRGALVSVQNLVIAGSSGLVQHAALFFYSCMQSFHIMEEAWKSRCKCTNGAVYKNGNFSVLPNGGGMFLFSATHWVFLFFIKKKGLCKFKKQIFGLFFFVEVLYCLQRDKVSQAHTALKALVKCPLPNSSPKFFLANTTDWMLRWWDLDGKWLFISVQINIPLVYSATIFV